MFKWKAFLNPSLIFKLGREKVSVKQFLYKLYLNCQAEPNYANYLY